MSISPSDSAIFGPLFSEPTTLEALSDQRFVSCMLQVETELAAVQAELGLIPKEAADAIAAAVPFEIDWERLQQATVKAGVPVAGLVAQLRQQVGEPHSNYVHWGATTQDIFDTARVLQLREVLAWQEETLAQLIKRLAALAEQHRHTLMAGRTHTQQAVPITFGYKVAGWLAPLLRHRQRLQELKPRLLVLQFGGAAGTLASLADKGLALQAALAKTLDLGQPPMPWHTQRDNVLELAAWQAQLSGSLGKVAADILLMAQSEVGELRETSDGEQGGSSTMPQKHNPVASELILAAALQNASLLSAQAASLVQEHERGSHGWQMEWLTLPQMLALCSSALDKARALAETLVVDEARMQANVAASQGMMLAEALSMRLRQHLSKQEAGVLLQEWMQAAKDSGGNLLEVAKASQVADIDWSDLDDEGDYLGSLQAFIDRVLSEI